MLCAHARRPIFDAFSPARSVSERTDAPPRLHPHGRRPCGPDTLLRRSAARRRAASSLRHAEAGGASVCPW
ncbi:hypothetical protein AcW1_004717 [Taiwanofungus camphoratus]|nr:hypothetical protein AcW1_004717 [Antrodia cinnamomea]